MPHATHGMAHTTHAMESSARPNIRAVTDTRPAGVAPAHVSGALAMDAVFAMNGFSVGVRTMRCRVAGPTGAAHDFAKVQSVVMRNFSPAFATLELTYYSVEALPRRVSQQVGFLQSAPAKPR